MLRIFIGDRERSMATAKLFLGDDSISFDENSPVESIMPLLEGDDLFGGRHSARLDGVLENDQLRQAIVDRLDLLIRSKNIFALLEEKIDSDTLLLFEEAGIKVVRSPKAAKGRPAFNVFSLADALCERDRRNLWFRYGRAAHLGESPEAIAGILFWQLKSLLFALKGEVKSLSPYVALKARRALSKYSEEEVKSLALKVVTLYHDAHRGKMDLIEGLERMILSI